MSGAREDIFEQTVERFLQELQTPGSLAQKLQANLEAQISDIRAYLILIESLFIQALIKQQKLATFSEQSQKELLADRSEKTRLERIYQLQKEVIDAQMKTIEEKAYKLPVTSIEKMRDDLTKSLEKATEAVKQAQQKVNQKTAEFLAKGKKLDTTRAAILQKAQDIVKLSDKDFATAQRALNRRPPAATVFEKTQGKYVTPITLVTNDVMQMLIEPELKVVPPPKEKSPPKAKEKESWEDPDEIEYEDEDESEEDEIGDRLALVYKRAQKFNNLIGEMIDKESVDLIESDTKELAASYKESVVAKKGTSETHGYRKRNQSGH